MCALDAPTALFSLLKRLGQKDVEVSSGPSGSEPLHNPSSPLCSNAVIRPECFNHLKLLSRIVSIAAAMMTLQCLRALREPSTYATTCSEEHKYVLDGLHQCSLSRSLMVIVSVSR